MENVWESRLSTVAKNTRPSPVREILKVITQEGMISFAGGMPAPEVFPVEEFYEGASVLRDKGRTVLQYGITEGDPDLRNFLASWSAKRMGRTAAADEIILTTGSQQAIDLIAWSLIDPGDVIITEDPTYLAALSAFSNHGATFESVPMDSDGMITDELPALINKIRSSGRRPKLIYTVVNFQNPSGVCLSLERRKRLAEISSDMGVPVFEDDPYGYLRYDGEHLPSIYSFDPDGAVIYAGSFSKILSPAVRIGWIIGNRRIIRQLTVFKQSTDICSSPITHSLAYEYCRKGYLDSHLPKILKNYAVKRDAMQKSFETRLSPLGVKWVKPAGGFFFWLDFGKNADTRKLAVKALEKKVAFIPAEPFCVNPENAGRYGRFNFSYSDPETIEKGVVRLAETIKDTSGY